MKIKKILKYIVVLVLLNGLILVAKDLLPNRQTPHEVNKANLEKLPLPFIPNRGQFGSTILFQARITNGIVSLTKEGIQLSFLNIPKSENVNNDFEVQASDTGDDKSQVLYMRFQGVSPYAEISEGEPLPGVANFLIGNNPDNWQTEISTYKSVVYNELYPGINLLYSGEKGILKGTYTVASNRDPDIIRWSYTGAEDIEVEAVSGDLLIILENGSVLREQAPVVWQEIEGQHIIVDAKYKVDGVLLGFELGNYNSNFPLTIDPTLIYSTYFGGSQNEQEGIGRFEVDSQGNVYITGKTYSSDLPMSNPIDSSLSGESDVFVTKFNPVTNTLIYSTYIGGNSIETGNSIVADNEGNAYIVGNTGSSDFPVVNPIQAQKQKPFDPTEIDTFVMKLNANGSSILFSTYLGGTKPDDAWSIALNSIGEMVISGNTQSLDFPIVNAIQNSSGNVYGGNVWDVFLAKLDSTGSNLMFSTYLGGWQNDIERGLDIDSQDNIYLTGYVGEDYPTTPGVFNNVCGEPSAFVTKVSSQGNMVYSTCIGGGQAWDLAVDDEGFAYITGHTGGSFPTVNAYDNNFDGLSDAFITKMNPTGSSLIFSTYLGGSIGNYFNSRGQELGYGIFVDGNRNIYVTGGTNSTDFPLLNPIQTTLGDIPNGGNYDAYIAKFSELGYLEFSTFLGGTYSDWGGHIFVTNSGKLYIRGETNSPDFPTFNALQTTLGGIDRNDAFMAIIDLQNNTPSGSNVVYSEGGVTLTFSTVTGSGDTVVITSSTGTAPPTGFKLGNPPTYYNISTTAVFSGTVEICVNYDQTSIVGSENQLKLMHFVDSEGWVDATTSLDTANNVICGTVTDFSEFAMMKQPNIQDLINRVQEMNLQQGIENSLDVKLQRAQDAMNAENSNNVTETVNALEAFINEVEAQRGNKLTDNQANELRSFAYNLIKIIQGFTTF